MTHCGRIYVNPMNKREIFINVGHLFKGCQIYPSYEPWLAPFIKEDQYRTLINVLEREFEKTPFDTKCPTCCSLMLCWSGAMTVGAGSILGIPPFFYIRHRINSFTQDMEGAVRNVIQEINANVVDVKVAHLQNDTHLQCFVHPSATFCNCCVTQPIGSHNGRWKDSKGEPLMYPVSSRLTVQGGPPPGYSVVLTVSTEIEFQEPQPVIAYQPQASSAL